MPIKKTVLFDFDGVIADSFSAAFEANKNASPGLTESDFCGFFDGNINDWGKTSVAPDERQRIREEFFRKYLPLIKQLKIFPGMKDAIIKLEKSFRLIIVSSTITSPIREFMERHNMAEYFKEIMGNDVHASKIQKIKMVFTKYKIGPKDCVFVTDTLGDMREAATAGVQSIAVAWGFHDKERLGRGGPFRIVEKPDDLYAAVADCLARDV